MNPPSLIHVKTRLQDAMLDPSCFCTVCFATFRLTRALESRLEKCACPPSHTSFILVAELDPAEDQTQDCVGRSRNRRTEPNPLCFASCIGAKFVVIRPSS